MKCRINGKQLALSALDPGHMDKEDSIGKKNVHIIRYQQLVTLQTKGILLYTSHHIIYPHSYVQIVVESLPASSLRPDHFQTKKLNLFVYFLFRLFCRVIFVALRIFCPMMCPDLDILVDLLYNVRSCHAAPSFPIIKYTASVCVPVDQATHLTWSALIELRVSTWLQSSGTYCDSSWCVILLYTQIQVGRVGE
jgi:hypothetical protein